MLSNTSTERAPWYVIPADDKPFARVTAAGVIANALIEIDPRYPTVGEEARAALQVARVDLEGEAPPGTAPGPDKTETGATKKSKKGKGKGKR